MRRINENMGALPGFFMDSDGVTKPTEPFADLKIYRDATNVQITIDPDAASNGKAINVYGGVVAQNYLTIGQAALNTTYTLYCVGHAKASGNVIGNCIETLNGVSSLVSNQAELRVNIPISGVDSITHGTKLQIDSSDIIVAQATGDGAGGITDKAVGLYGVTPVTQAAHIADPAASIAANNAAIDAILVALENIGITASA